MNPLATLGNVPVTTDIVASLYPDIRAQRGKVARLAADGQLIRLKRGLYVVAPAVSGRLLSSGLIANHLYGPSYVSMQTALRHYGLIPEAVHQVRSMTVKHSRRFVCDIGTFDYISCPPDYFSIGIDQATEEGSTFLIASPEKALCDLIIYTPGLRLRFLGETCTFLEEDLRMDLADIRSMSPDVFHRCAEAGKASAATLRNVCKIITHSR